MAKSIQPKSGEKLTKKAFMEIHVGLYLVSNVFNNDGHPAFNETVVKISDREDQWSRIKNARADQRHFWLYKSKDEYDKVMNKIQGQEG